MNSLRRDLSSRIHFDCLDAQKIYLKRIAFFIETAQARFNPIHMKTIKPFILFFSLVSTGCSTAGKTYHIWAGGRMDSYTENLSEPIDVQLQKMVGGTVTTTSGDRNKITSTGKGGQIGITEQFGHLVSTLGLFYVKYDPVNYTFNTSAAGQISERIEVSGYGLDGTIGYNLWYFRPGISYKWESQTGDATVSSATLGTSKMSNSDTVFSLGGGLAIDVPLSNSLHIVGQGDYRVPLSVDAGVSSANNVIAQLGLRFAEFQVGGDKK